MVILALIVVGTGAFVWAKLFRYQKEAVSNAVQVSQLAAPAREPTPMADSTPTAPVNSSEEFKVEDAKATLVAVPPELNIAMDFYSQAPFENWDYPWQEACEEASVLLIANTYFEHHWTREQFRDEILKLVEWETKEFGDYKHTTADQTAKILRDYLHLKPVILENPSFEDIQQSLAKGHLLVGLFAGKHLGNPFFRNGGPNYHAMVLKGYKSGDSTTVQKIITEDVGTKRGEDYVYSWSVLQNAMHDYAEPIEVGAPRMIEVSL